MVACVENPEKQKLLELINEFSKAIRYMINIEKAIFFLSTSRKNRKLKQILNLHNSMKETLKISSVTDFARQFHRKLKTPCVGKLKA